MKFIIQSCILESKGQNKRKKQEIRIAPEIQRQMQRQIK